MKQPPLTPLTVTLQGTKGELAIEATIPLESFPDMIEVETSTGSVRQFFRIGITDRRAFYKEGTSYRMPPSETEPASRRDLSAPPPSSGKSETASEARIPPKEEASR